MNALIFTVSTDSIAHGLIHNYYYIFLVIVILVLEPVLLK